MSLINKSDVDSDIGVSLNHRPLLTVTPASESDATGDSTGYDKFMVERDELTEVSAVLVEKSKTRLTLPQTSKEAA